MHEGIALIKSGNYSGGTQKLRETIDRSSRELHDSYNPFPFLCHYYIGMGDVLNNQLNKAQREHNILDSLIQSKTSDWRFEDLAQLLGLEIALAKGEPVDPSKVESRGLFPLNRASVGFIRVSYLSYWKMGKYNEAIKVLDPFDQHMMASSSFYGGDQTLITS